MTLSASNVTLRQASPANGEPHTPENPWLKFCWDVTLAVVLAIVFAAVFAVVVDRWLHPERDACDVAVSRAGYSRELAGPAVLNCLDHPRKRAEVRV